MQTILLFSMMIQSSQQFWQFFIVVPSSLLPVFVLVGISNLFDCTWNKI